MLYLACTNRERINSSTAKRSSKYFPTAEGVLNDKVGTSTPSEGNIKKVDHINNINLLICISSTSLVRLKCSGGVVKVLPEAATRNPSERK